MAIPALIECLDDVDWEVRSDAAEALSKLGAYEAGKSLVAHLQNEPLPAYVFALGWIGYRDAIPVLIGLLQSKLSKIRGGAAWSLGQMRASEAKDSLYEAIQSEKDDWVLECLLDAFTMIDNNWDKADL